MATIEQWLKTTQDILTSSGIETARLDTLVLLEDALHTNRAQILAHPEQFLAENVQAKLDMLVARRSQHEPLAYIRGKAEFYGREFIVSPAVLVPRPESEAMIDLLKELVLPGSLESSSVPQNELIGYASDSLKATPSRNDKAEASNANPIVVENNQNALKVAKKYLTSKPGQKIKIADIGTGSGNLGITAALEIPHSDVSLLEIDSAAIEITRQNVKAFELQLPVIKTDLLDSSSQDFDILLCNLPYVPTNYPVNLAAQKEPKLALFSGVDGLDAFRRLFMQVRKLAYKPRLILTESLPSQHADLTAIAALAGYDQIAKNDFVQVFLLSE